MQNKQLNIPPAYVPGTVGNLFNCGITSLSGPVGYTQTQPYVILKHVRIMNNDSSPHTVTFYKGATGGSTGGTEVMFDHVSVPANSYLDWQGYMRFDSADFLSGVADSASKITWNGDGEIGLA
jgi:hypothetical protein